MTGNKKVDIFLKKFLSQQEITENFLDFLQNLVKENLYWIVRTSGVFTPDVATQDILSSSGADTFDVFTPLVGTDGVKGHIISLDPTEASAIPFENTAAIVYHVGLRFIEIPVDSEVNVRTGEIKFRLQEERIGVKADPDSVVDDGDETLTVIVDSVTEAGVDNSGRTVRIWLKDPKSEAQLFEEATVIWDGTNNKIETTTALGQILGSISTTASDYQVALIGPEVKRNTDLRLDPDVMYIGNITGNGGTPTVFDHADVVDISDGLGTLSSLFNVEHSSVDGTHTDVTVQTITTKQATPGVQLDTQVNASDEDTPDAPTSHTLFSSGGGSGLQGVKWRLRDSGGSTIAFIDAHGNLYVQNLAAVVSTFQSNVTIEGDQSVEGSTTLGDDEATDFVTFNSVLRSATRMRFLIDSNNDESGIGYEFYNHTLGASDLLLRLGDDGKLQITNDIFINSDALIIDLDADNDGTSESFRIRKDGTTVLLDLTADGDLTALREVLAESGVVYALANNTGTAITGVNASLNEVFDETGFRNLLQVYPNTVNDTILNIKSSRFTNADGSDFVMPIGQEVSNYPGGTVDFSTGVNSVGDNFTPIDFTGQASQWAKYSLNLLKDNTVVVLPADGFGASKSAAPNPPLSNDGIPFAVIAVQDNGSAGVGTINDVSEANIDRLPASGGAGATGDASTILSRIEDALTNSPFLLAFDNVFANDRDDKIDGSSTGSFSAGSEAFVFSSQGETLVSIDQTIQSFLDVGKLPGKVQLYSYWNEETVSFQDTDAANVGSTVFDAASNQAKGQQFTLGQRTFITDLSVWLERATTNNAGHVILSIVRDDGSGLPSTDSTDVLARNDGFNTQDGEIPTGTLTKMTMSVNKELEAGDYHIVSSVNNAYIANLTPNPTHTVSQQEAVAAGSLGRSTYNGTVWASAVGKEAYEVNGVIDKVDELATTEVSRDGGNNYQDFTTKMTRDPFSGLVSGEHCFTEEQISYQDTFSSSDDSTIFSGNTGPSIQQAQSFILAEETEISQVGLFLRRFTNPPDGNITLKLVHESTSGTPETSSIIAQSDPIVAADLPDSAAGQLKQFDVDKVLQPGTYFIVGEGDQTYKDFVDANPGDEAAVTNESDNTINNPWGQIFNGTIWSLDLHKKSYQVDGFVRDTGALAAYSNPLSNIDTSLTFKNTGNAGANDHDALGIPFEVLNTTHIREIALGLRTGGAAGGEEEVQTVSFAMSVGSVTPGDYFLVDGLKRKYAVFYEEDGSSGNAPSVPGRFLIKVDILSSDSASTIRNKTNTELNADSDFTEEFTTATPATDIELTSKFPGEMVDAANGAVPVPSLTFAVTNAGTDSDNSFSVSIVKDDGSVQSQPSADRADYLITKTLKMSVARKGTTETLRIPFTAVLTPGLYFVVIETDSSYKALASSSDDFSIGIDASTIAAREISAGNGDPLVWAGEDDRFAVPVEFNGGDVDLRLRITSSRASVELEGYGLLYDLETQIGSNVLSERAVRIVDLSAPTDTFTITEFFPNPELLTVWIAETGDSYKAPGFNVSGSVITFPAGTFPVSSGIRTVIFDQNNGGAFDNSDRNLALLAANHLGSQDSNVDKSVPGRGVLLRNAAGLLREVTLDELDNIFIKSVP